MANTADTITPLAPDCILVEGVVDETAIATVVATHVIVTFSRSSSS